MIDTPAMRKNVQDAMQRWFRLRGENKKELDICRAQMKLKKIYRHQLVEFFEWCDFHMNTESNGTSSSSKKRVIRQEELDELEMLINSSFEDEVSEEAIPGEFPEDFAGYAPGQVKKNRFDEDDLVYIYTVLTNSVTEEKATLQYANLDKVTKVENKNVFKKDGEWQHKKLIVAMLTTGDVVLDPNRLKIYENVMKYCEHPEDPELFHSETFWKIVNVGKDEKYIQEDGTPLDYKIFYEGVKSDEINPLAS